MTRPSLSLPPPESDDDGCLRDELASSGICGIDAGVALLEQSTTLDTGAQPVRRYPTQGSVHSPTRDSLRSGWMIQHGDVVVLAQTGEPDLQRPRSSSLARQIRPTIPSNHRAEAQIDGPRMNKAAAYPRPRSKEEFELSRPNVRKRAGPDKDPTRHRTRRAVTAPAGDAASPRGTQSRPSPRPRGAAE